MRGKKHAPRKHGCSIPEQSRDAYIADRHSNRDTSRLVLWIWRGERWKPLEAGEEDEEGRSMAPTRLPRYVRQAKAALWSLRLATSPASLPLVWPPRLHHSTCAVLLSLVFVPRSPHSSLFYCKFVCPHLV